MTDTPARLAQLVEELKHYQSELEAQNQALHYSRVAAEGASERFESLFSKVPLALMVVDELGMVAQSNDMALSLFRPQESDPPLNFLLPLIHEEHQERVGKSFGLAQSDGSSMVLEVLFKHGLNGTLLGDLHIARIEYSKDSMAHFICAVIDQAPLMSERLALKLRNEELQLSKSRMEAILNSSLEAIICTDDQFLMTIINPAAAKLFQCPAEQALSASLAIFLPEVVKTLNIRTTSNSLALGEVAGQTLDGTPLNLEIRVTYERYSEGRIITVFARDLTFRKAMEQQLRESQKMQAIGTLAGGIAHDFNNILGAILGNVDLARQDALEPAKVMVCLGEIDLAARRARDLVRQILTFSRNEVQDLHPLKLGPLITDSVRLLKVGLPPQIRLSTQLHRDAPWVLADRTKIGQALLNLCSNGIQAIGQSKGQVEVVLQGTTLNARDALTMGISAGDYALVQISDSGCGMDDATMKRIFEPFFTTKEVGQGTGLGLSVVHGVMRAHHGAVEVTSTVGAGSTFKLYFPALNAQQAQAQIQGLAARQQLSAAPADTARTATQPFSQAHVMYVDDDTALAFLIKRALSRKGYRVTTYNDPREAILALQDPKLEVELLVTDFNMPGYSGVELLNEVGALRPQLPLALASGYITPEIEAQARAAGARALIHKPNDVEEICATVEHLLQTQRS
jgi:PAS domain S-box-containing protein